jgi:hypothetical protein
MLVWSTQMKRMLVCLLLFAQQATAGDWQGIHARFRDAQVACQNINSRACEPYLAEAVAVGEILQDQAVVKDVSPGHRIVQLPGSKGVMMVCGNGVLSKLNGLTLLHTAFVIDAAPDAYWDIVLFRAVLFLCEAEKP